MFEIEDAVFTFDANRKKCKDFFRDGVVYVRCAQDFFLCPCNTEVEVPLSFLPEYMEAMKEACSNSLRAL